MMLVVLFDVYLIKNNNNSTIELKRWGKMNNLWILTEEKPKISVIMQLFSILSNDLGYQTAFDETLVLEPMINADVFSFTYKLKGTTSLDFKNVYVKIVSGSSSFMDYLVFLQPSQPIEGGRNNLLFAVEETKTSDDESRNTGVYQRCSKFAYIKAFFGVPLYMLYNDELGLRESKKPSDTSIFGTNMLLTIGVKILGKPIDKYFKKFTSIDEVVQFKDKMRMPPGNNVPIKLIKLSDRIEVSARLDKPKNIGKIAHDPNIGAVSIIAQTLRELGWTKDIVVTKHNATQEYVTKTKGKNKLLYICKLLDIKFDRIIIPKLDAIPLDYWHYEVKSEKVASILFHVLYENKGYKEVYQNHAGCERGYFKTKDDRLLVLPKYVSDGSNLLIPDVVLRNDDKKEILLIEGKKLSTISNGLKEIEDYDDIENLYIKRYYPNYSVERFLTIYGGKLKSLPHHKVLLYLNEDGLVKIKPR
jgi:hypothetical protein